MSERRSFHEAPLVLFTALATMGSGVGAAHLLGVVFGAGSLPVPQPVALLLTGLMAAGLLASVGHLGRPLRGMRALQGVGRSPLSREVVAVGSTLAVGSACVLLPSSSSSAPWLGLLLSAASVATLVSLGLVYRFPHQVAWGGPAVLQPVVLGTLWGWLALGLLAGRADGLPGSTGAGAVLGVLLVGDAALWLLRVRGWLTGRSVAESLHPPAAPRSTLLLFGRVALVTLFPVGLLLVGVAGGALLSLTLGVFADRLAFYALALRISTESELARIEALL